MNDQEQQKKELNLEEMEQVIGGGNEGGYARKPHPKDGCFIQKIASGEKLEKIAWRYGTTVKRIMSVNPELVVNALNI